MLKKKSIELYEKITEFIFGKTITSALIEFLNYKEYENVSSRTIEYYNDNIQYFTRFCHGKTRCKKIKDKVIMDYVSYMKKILNVNDVTINIRLRACRAFFYYCMKKDYIKKFTISLIKVRNEKQKIIYSNEELKRLLVMPELDKSVKLNFTNFRNWVITNYVISTR